MDSNRPSDPTARRRPRWRTLLVLLLLLALGAALLTWMLQPRPVLAVTLQESEGSDRGAVVLLDPLRGEELARFPVAGAPTGVAFTPAGTHVLVAGQKSARVTIHGVPGLSLQGDFAVEERPVNLWFGQANDAFFVDYGPQGQKAYGMPNLASRRQQVGQGQEVARGTLELRNVKGLRPASPDTTGPRPRQVFIDMELTEALVADSATGNVVGSVPVGPRAIAMGWGPGDRKCYVVVNGEDAVKVLDPEKLAVTRTIPVGSSPNFFERVSGTHLAVVLHQRADTLSIVDLDRDEVRQTVSLGGLPVRVDCWPKVHVMPQGPRPAPVAQNR